MYYPDQMARKKQSVTPSSGGHSATLGSFLHHRPTVTRSPPRISPRAANGSARTSTNPAQPATTPQPKRIAWEVRNGADVGTRARVGEACLCAPHRASAELCSRRLAELHHKMRGRVLAVARVECADLD